MDIRQRSVVQIVNFFSVTLFHIDMKIFQWKSVETQNRLILLDPEFSKFSRAKPLDQNLTLQLETLLYNANFVSHFFLWFSCSIGSKISMTRSSGEKAIKSSNNHWNLSAFFWHYPMQKPLGSPFYARLSMCGVHIVNSFTNERLSANTLDSIDHWLTPDRPTLLSNRRVTYFWTLVTWTRAGFKAHSDRQRYDRRAFETAFDEDRNSYAVCWLCTHDCIWTWIELNKPYIMQ